NLDDKEFSITPLWGNQQLSGNEDWSMKEFVAYIVKNLVDHPDKVKINEIGGTQTLIIELSVEKSDIGKIIGKKGKTINAIRTLLMSVASRNGIRVNLEILEEGGVPRVE